MFELLRRYLGPFRALAVIGPVAKLIEATFDVITPLVIAYMIDAGVAARDMGAVARGGVALVVMTLVGYGFTLVDQRCAARTSQGVGTALRHDVMARVTSYSGRDLAAFGGPSLVARVTSDVNQVQLAIALGMRQLVRWPYLALGSLVAALLIDWQLGLVFLGSAIAVSLVFWLVMSRSVPYFARMQAGVDTMLRLARETLEGTRVVRAFRRVDYERARFDRVAQEQVRVSVASARVSSLLNPASMAILDAAIIAILWFGGVRVDAGDLTQGQVMAFVNYMIQTLAAIGYIANIMVIFTRASASATRIVEVLDHESSVVDGAGAVALDGMPALELVGVGLAYDEGGRALEGVSLALAPGETLGVIGGTGSGKTTLARLLGRSIDANEGTLYVCGADVRDWRLADLHQVVSVVPQVSSLMSGTIADNLRWRDASAGPDALWEALGAAQADDFVRELPNGLDTWVEAGGRNFSGGQRQRLCVARALVGNPRVLVLDSVTSALDTVTAARLREAVARLEPRPACVVISQRVADIVDCDQVLVLYHGAVAGLGTHNELMRSCRVYQDTVSSQDWSGNEGVSDHE